MTHEPWTMALTHTIDKPWTSTDQATLNSHQQNNTTLQRHQTGIGHTTNQTYSLLTPPAPYAILESIYEVYIFANHLVHIQMLEYKIITGTKC